MAVKTWHFQLQQSIASRLDTHVAHLFSTRTTQHHVHPLQIKQEDRKTEFNFAIHVVVDDAKEKPREPLTYLLHHQGNRLSSCYSRTRRQLVPPASTSSNEMMNNKALSFASTS
jgi:hypothetical protein